MYLKSLEMKGFKSFADRTVLQFEPGISVIVGPNGSGKSNVSEAFLWVMGEQAPRNLRAGRMEDVIFSGSDKRGPLGMAEVSLSFDNSGGTIPLEYEEVVVTRQLYRSGESGYLLNRAPTRLIDIQEMLSGFGLGRELTAVIGQNRLDRVISSRPEDRRALIEEAAGLLKHRRRKDKAMRKLEAVEQNMVRLGDIISEVKKQIKPLERQAAVAREFKELEAELRSLQISMVVAELEALRLQWDNRVEEEERIRAEFEERQAFLGEGRRKQLEDEKRAHELRESLASEREDAFRLSSCLERLRSEEQLASERMRFYLQLEGMPLAGAGDLLRRREERARRLGELEGLHREAQRGEGELAGRIRQEEAARYKAAGDLAALNKRRGGVAEEVRQGRQQLRYLVSQAESLEEEGKRGLQRRRDDEERLEAGERAAEEAAADLRRLEEHARRSRRELARLEAERESLRAELLRFRERLEEVARRQRVCEGDEIQIVARLQALQELFSRRVDYAAAAARVLQEGGCLRGVRGMLLHHVKIDPEWEKALESLLGPWLFAVVVESKEAAVAAVSLLKEEEAGFALFLPLSEFAGRPAGPGSRSALVHGALPAVEAVEADPSLDGLLEHLLGDVALCSSLEEALSKSEVYPRITFLTPEGEMVSPRQVIKGGRAQRSPFHLLGKQREIEQLQEALESFDDAHLHNQVERKAVLATLEKLEADLAALEGRMEGARRAIHRNELDHQKASLRAEEARERVARLREALEEHGAGARQLEERRSALLEEEAAVRAAVESLEPDLAALDEEMRAGRTLLDGREKELRELYQSRASLEERIRNLAERMEEVRLALEEMPSDPAEVEEEMARDREGHRRLIEVVRRLQACGEAVAGRCEIDRGLKESELRELEEGIGRARLDLEACASRVEELRELVHNRDMMAVQLKSRVDMLAEKLLSEHRVSLEEALQEYRTEQPVEGMRERAEALQRRKEAMGQVNLLAVEELQAAGERYQFLTAQVEDLRQSKGALNKVIRAVEREIMSIFKETYDEVNLHFQELFERLFPNGRAELTLTDPEDLLDTGVEVAAQPPGKRLKKLSLLSGGETSLTSLAFLFAIFKARPSPFYFLDEVEAALDDMNLHRFLRMLMEFKEDSQLIIITHQKRTMEIAEVLYGVSMQADGVSRVISQRFQEEKEEDAVPA